MKSQLFKLDPLAEHFYQQKLNPFSDLRIMLLLYLVQVRKKLLRLEHFPNQIPGRLNIKIDFDAPKVYESATQSQVHAGTKREFFFSLDGGRLGDNFERSGRCAWWIAADGNLLLRRGAPRRSHTQHNTQRGPCVLLKSREPQRGGGVGWNARNASAGVTRAASSVIFCWLARLFVREAPQVEISHMERVHHLLETWAHALGVRWRPRQGPPDRPGDFFR